MDEDRLKQRLASLEKACGSLAAGMVALEGVLNALITTHPNKGLLLAALEETYEADTVTELFDSGLPEEVNAIAKQWRDVWLGTVRQLGSVHKAADPSSSADPASPGPPTDGG